MKGDILTTARITKNEMSLLGKLNCWSKNLLPKKEGEMEEFTINLIRWECGEELLLKEKRQ